MPDFMITRDGPLYLKAKRGVRPLLDRPYFSLTHEMSVLRLTSERLRKVVMDSSLSPTIASIAMRPPEIVFTRRLFAGY